MRRPCPFGGTEGAKAAQPRVSAAPGLPSRRSRIPIACAARCKKRPIGATFPRTACLSGDARLKIVRLLTHARPASRPARHEGQRAMSNIPEIPKQKQNQYLFGAVGAVLGAVMGLGIAGPVAAVVGLSLGGLAGYHFLTRFGK